MSGPVRVNMYNSPWIRLVLTKAVWAAWRIAIPLALWRVPLGQFAALFLIAELASGYWLAWNFEVSHLVTDVDWPNGEKHADKLADSWAVAQVKSSLDYGHNDTIQTFLCGALNYQVRRPWTPAAADTG